MPSIPFYASSEDSSAVVEHLNASADLAFLVSAGPRQWVAVKAIDSIRPGRHCLWHIASGPLPLVRTGNQDDQVITDPFEPWTEARTGADSSTPYFGAGHPGVVWLNMRSEELSRRGEAVVGLSSFEWIGNHYRIIGNAAQPQTETVWKGLRRWIGKIGIKVPRGGPAEVTSPEVWALPGAQKQFEKGLRGGSA
jgi:hypothetical protein